MLKEISIEIIRKCPNFCVHCSSCSNLNCNEIISLSKFKELIDQAKELGLQTVCFSGGEPFLHPDISEMVYYVNQSGLKSTIYTSGIYYNDERKVRTSLPDRILNAISKYVTKLIFNIECASSVTYDYIMGTVGCFEIMKESISKAVNHGIMVEGHFVPMHCNFNQIDETISLCESLKVSKLSFLRLVPHGRANANLNSIALSSEELLIVKNHLEEKLNSRTYSIRIGVPISGETDEIHCEAANGKLNIRYDGNVYPCEVFKNNSIACLKNLNVGNIHKMSLIDIYNTSELLLKVREMVKEFHCKATCENCIGQYYIQKETK